ncbi:hypothetical protein AB6A40_011025 [Gnathostoma spinigerum]|uniref:DNA-directed RNA polymerase n=1 Tax=Gnathostoma spinigerum TaxID=75299 RepID=A0ABD6EY91_9BILA
MLREIFFLIDYYPSYCSKYSLVFLNGVLIGLTNDPGRIVRTIRAVRRHGLLNEFVSVSTNAAQRSVFLASDGGRLCRPYIIVSNGVPRVNQEHIEVGIIPTYLFLNSNIIKSKRIYWGIEDEHCSG